MDGIIAIFNCPQEPTLVTLTGRLSLESWFTSPNRFLLKTLMISVEGFSMFCLEIKDTPESGKRRQWKTADEWR